VGSKASRLRQALGQGRGDGGSPVLAIGAHDGLGARLAEEAGFGAVWASGLEISVSAGVPDAGLLTMTQLLERAVEMDLAGSLPVVADCDTGFGNSHNVMHMLRRYEAAGIAAVCMEDKRTPKLNSFVRGRQELAPVAEFVGKLLAAQAARRGDGPLIIARTEALVAGAGLEQALTRARAYRRAGADAILIHSRSKEPDEVLAFLEAWDGELPVAVVPTSYPGIGADDLHRAGASLVIYANQGLRAAVAAQQRTLASIAAERSTASVEETIAPVSRLFDLSGMPELQADERRFLRGERAPGRVVIPAGGDLDLPDDLAALSSGPGSRAFLDLAGKTLVQRQVETLAQVGVADVSLVGPFEPDALSVPGLSVVNAPAAGLLSTVRAGLDAAPCPDGGRVAVCYSDVLFGAQTATALFSASADVALLVDRAFHDVAQPSPKRLDLLCTDPPPEAGPRALAPARGRAVTAIGKQLDPAEAHYEFIGLMSLNEAGLAAVRAVLEAAGRRTPFGEAADLGSATLTDLLAELLEAGVPVTAYPQDRGWMEIHDFAAWRSAVEELSREGD
jgi:phosphoenolpyruvate phosphomutase